ncbi:ABC transporter ATP-binding protein [Actinomadura sp. GC306]|uniref:ABC transporter ATP-binding protein n=1 Tax=Actinomadura sp. GC306 TaxID=2530367 RepID=UPI00105249B5|nr:ABC transporter ATP-binding protein [Actinomadura sp. GC306]TDC62557.1 ABC transporter ATP-binding protein [Actinomadura sp. GC306]
MTVPVLELREVSRVYSGTPPVEALKPCNLTVRPADHIAITGPSGSGKSTLLNVLGLLDQISSGNYYLHGEDVSTLKEHRRAALRNRYLGFVFQAFHLLSYRTALENVELSMLYAGIPRKSRAQRAMEALSRVGLEHRTDAFPPTLSGGERQRVAIARAIVARPSVLLCDEPTGSLDSGMSNSILELLDELNRDGLTLIVVTHEHDVAARARRRVAIHDGVLSEAEGSGS